MNIIKQMIIDPARDGCAIWYDGCVQDIKAYPIECIKRIVEYLEKNHEYIKPNGDTCLDIELLLDVNEYGRLYADAFDDFGIAYTKIKIDKIV